MSDPWQGQVAALGEFIRAQRRLAKLTLRQMADLADVSNPYLSQIERGLHTPSVKVLKSIADALDLSAETLLAHAGLLPDGAAGEAGDDGPSERRPTVEAAIRLDRALTDGQKEALLAVYRSYLAANGRGDEGGGEG